MNAHSAAQKLGSNMRLHRERVGMPQAELARRLKIHRRTLRKLECSCNSISRAAAAANELGVPLQELLEGVG